LKTMETEAEKVLAIWVHFAANESLLIPFHSRTDAANYSEVSYECLCNSKLQI
jgi:hypothetical protein